MKENDEVFRKWLAFFWLIILVMFAYNITWFCFDFLHADFQNPFFNICYIVYLKIGKVAWLFDNPYVTLIVNFILALFIIISDTAPKKDKLKFFKKEFVPTKSLGRKIIGYTSIVYFINPLLLVYSINNGNPSPHPIITLFYIVLLICSFYGIIYGGAVYTASLDETLDREDEFNQIEESAFKQNEELIETDDSVNLRTIYKYMKEVRHGWINIINPFRATMVLGTPGSGKSFAIINQMIRQQLKKGYCMYCYDYKFPTLSEIVYNNTIWNEKEFVTRYGCKPKICVVNFDDPRKSHRCNPIKAEFLEDQAQAVEIATVIALNLQKDWIKNQDFFAKSAISLLKCAIWYLARTEGGKYCTFPHVIELICSPMDKMIPLMYAHLDSLNSLDLKASMSNFFESWKNGAVDQLSGQVASIQIAITDLISDGLYWALSGDDFTLDLNNPNEPKILCLGNNPEYDKIYGVALGLFNGRVTKLTNKQNKAKLSIIVDELPTIYFMGLDNLIATARSNKIAVCLGFQDFSQLEAVYGKEEASKIIKTIGNVFSGQVFDETAKNLSERFGKNKQQKKSMSINDSGTSISISEQLDYMIPQSRISQLSQGKFVGLYADDFGKESDHKVFHCNIDVDMDAVKREKKEGRQIPDFKNFDDKQVFINLRNLYYELEGNENLKELAKSYFESIKSAKNPKELLTVYDKISSEDETGYVKKRVQSIRDKRMNEILRANHDKISADIVELLDNQMKELQNSTDNRLKEIWLIIQEKNKGKKK